MTLPWIGEVGPTGFITTVLAMASIVLMAQSATGLFTQAKTRTLMNRRLKLKFKTDATSQLIVELRRQRALNEEGGFKLASKWLNRLITRSGLNFQPTLWAGLAVAAALVFGAAAWRITGSAPVAVGVALVVLPTGPYIVLKQAAARRAKKLSRQLVDALQVAARSLEAGHPVPSAISLVAREMPDPIGTEFGMAADEMAYGLPLSEAVARLAARAGDGDVDLFAATVRLQEKTGGNLCELLKASVATIRERQTLTLKVKAASSEGRASAMILTAAPFIVVALVWLVKPDFYGSVMHIPAFQKTVIGFGVWMAIGNMVINKMINFRM